MGRRFLNLFVESNRTRLYSLRRIAANRLFYRSTRAAEEATAKSQESFRAYVEEHGGNKHPGLHLMDEFGQFPCPLLNLQPTPMHHRNSRTFELITPLGNDESKILAADNHGNTVLFDATSWSVVSFPKLNCSKGYGAMSVSINRATPNEPDSLYVLNIKPYAAISNLCFEVLSYGGFHERVPKWCPLPPPPVASSDTPASITSYAVVDNSTIYISSEECGTHAFDTVSRQWRPISRLWTMPFSGKAEYVPELKLWFGLSDDHPYSLCACDLTNKHSELHTWVDLDIPESWLPSQLNLISLGSGRFCVAKIFSSMTDDDLIDYRFAVFTGLQMVCPRGKDDHQGDVRMIKHKSIFYKFSEFNIEWVI